MSFMLSSFNGNMLTSEEIELSKFYKGRDDSKKQKEDYKANQLRELALASQPLKVAGEVKKVDKPLDTAYGDGFIGGNKAKGGFVGSSSSGANKNPRDDRGGDSSDDDDNDTGKLKRKKAKKTEYLSDELNPDQFSIMGIVSASNFNPEEIIAKDGSELRHIKNEWELREFDYENNQTIAFKISIPKDSTRYSINILPPSSAQSDDGSTILFHFNPRNYKGKNVLILNHRQCGDWGRFQSLPLDTLPLLFGTTIELVIQIRTEGFFVFVNGAFACHQNHNINPSQYRSLKVQIPLMDDKMNPESAIFHRIWWGKKEPIHVDEEDLSYSQKASAAIMDNSQNEKRILWVGNLPKLEDKSEIFELKSYLEDLFKDNLGRLPLKVNINGPKGYAFVTVQTENMVATAVEKINGLTLTDEDGTEFTMRVTPSMGRV